jgi:putative hydroxymethylpyrimidine transport system substrate-binding protein
VKPLRWALALAVVVLLLSGCGEGGSEQTPERYVGPPRHLRIALDGQAGAENVGVLMAEKRGYFDDVYIEALITTPSAPDRALPYAAAGSVELGVSHLPQVVLARGRGVPIVAVGSLVPEPTAAMIWLEESRIGDIADLKGRTIAFVGDRFQKAFLQSILGRAGLTLADVKLERAEHELVPALLSRRADAIFGGSGNVEGVELEERGLEPVITPVQSVGIPAYDELVVIARRDFVSEDPQLVREVMAAVARGTAAAVEDPRGAVSAIEEAEEPDPRLNRRMRRAAVEGTLPVLSRSGYMDPEQAEDLLEWMREQGMIERDLPASALLTNDYLKPRS